MHPDVARLIKRVAPPAKPVYAGNPRKWSFLESREGFMVPDDYRSFIDTYGEGGFGREEIDIEVYNPFVRGETALFAHAKAFYDIRETFREFGRKTGCRSGLNRAAPYP